MTEVSVAITNSDEPARIDLCERCGSAFLECFDGEPGELSRGVLEQHLDRAARKAPRRARRSCPDCATPLAPQRYMGGPPVWRCSGCQAIYASRGELETLAAFRLPDEPPASVSLLARLRQLFFRGD